MTRIALAAALLALALPGAAGAGNVYFTQGEQLRHVQRPGGLQATLRALLAGPTAAERARGLRTTIPAGTRLRGVSLHGGVASIDLSRRFERGGGTASMTARLDQLVWTATQYPRVKSVRLILDGRPVRYLSGEGIFVGQPLTR